MEKIRGKTLKEWKDYCKKDNVPIKTMKYIACLEERIEQLTIPVVIKSVCPDCGYPIFKKSFEHYYRCEGCEWTGQTVL
jgi:hypothetical protein